MEPVSLIVGALAVCAGEAGKAAVSEAVKDAYTRLRSLVAARFAGRPSGEVALAQYEQKPEPWEGALTAELLEVGAADDSALVEAAQEVMAVADPSGSQRGKYQVIVRRSKGVQVGDHNTQHNQFGAPPPSSN